jgi:Holliday junction resolvase
MNTRKKGDNFERKVKKYFQSLNFFVVRQSASAFPDLIVINSKVVYFIECKMNKYISKEEKQELIRLSNLGNCLICYNEKGKIRFCDIYYKPKNINISN